MGGNPQHVKGSNRYDLSFSSSDLGPNKLDTCGFVVSPRFDLTTAPGHNGHLNKRAYVNYARGSNTFQVFTFEQLPNGSRSPRRGGLRRRRQLLRLDPRRIAAVARPRPTPSP